MTFKNNNFMNKKNYQKPDVRVVALRAASIVCGTSPDTHAFNSVGSGTQYSRSTGTWDGEED